jgi:hypothetical protein
VTKGNVTFLFGMFVTTKNVFVPIIKIILLLNDIGAAVVESRKGNINNKIEINNLHKILGQSGKASPILTGKTLGYKVIGEFVTCEARSIGKVG